MHPLDDFNSGKPAGPIPRRAGNLLNMRAGGLPKPHDLLVRKRRHRLAVEQAKAMIAEGKRLQHNLIHGTGSKLGSGAHFNRADLNAIVQQLESATEAAKQKLDSLTEMGDIESLRLQMAMDRMAKMMTALSNVLKKISETAGGITQNIK